MYRKNKQANHPDIYANDSIWEAIFLSKKWFTEKSKDKVKYFDSPGFTFGKKLSAKTYNGYSITQYIAVEERCWNSGDKLKKPDITAKFWIIHKAESKNNVWISKGKVQLDPTDLSKGHTWFKK